MEEPETSTLASQAFAVDVIVIGTSSVPGIVLSAAGATRPDAADCTRP
jgi:hypothetical protein